jgi:hypothetical protein
MATDWQTACGALRAFIAEHPDIKISTGVGVHPGRGSRGLLPAI